MIRGGGRTGLSWNVMISWYLWNFHTWLEMDLTSKNVLLEDKRRKTTIRLKWFWVLCQSWYDSTLSRHTSLLVVNALQKEDQKKGVSLCFSKSQWQSVVSKYLITVCLLCPITESYNNWMRQESIFILVFPIRSDWCYNWTFNYFGFPAMIPMECLLLEMRQCEELGIFLYTWRQATPSVPLTLTSSENGS